MRTAANRLKLDARGVRATYVYDGASRMTGRRFSDGTRVTMAYDRVGNRTSMQDSSGRYTYSYDAVNRLTTAIDRNAKRITYTYDAIGQRRYMLDPTAAGSPTASILSAGPSSCSIPKGIARPGRTTPPAASRLKSWPTARGQAIRTMRQIG